MCALRDRRVVRRLPLAEEVVADRPVPEQHVLDERLAVEDELHRLAHAVVAEHGSVDLHVDRARVRLGGADDLDRLVGRLGLRSDRVEKRDLLDLVAEQCVQTRSVVGDHLDLELVDPRAAAAMDAPVVWVALEERAHARFPADEQERPGADLLVEVRRAGRHNPERLLGQKALEVADRPVQVELDLGGRLDLRVVEVDRLDARERLRLVLRVRDVAVRVEHVLCRHRLAVVELHARAQLHVPDRRRLVLYLSGESEPRDRLADRPERKEALVDLLRARCSGVLRDVPRRKGVGRAAVVDRD